MTNLTLDKRQLCDIQGRLFELALKNKYDCPAFIEAFMNSRAAAALDDVYDRLQWAGEEYILEELEEETGGLKKAGTTYGIEVMYWTGYIYRYWHYYTNESSREIYKIADAQIMNECWLGFHTFDVEMAIDDLKEIFYQKCGEKKYQLSNEALHEKFEFRNIRPEEAEQAAEIERICFPPNEACSRDMMFQRVERAPELFLVAVDRRTGRLAGFLNGLSTKESSFRDEFFTNAQLYDPDGGNVMLLGLDVLPEYRGQGLARELMSRYQRRERDRGRHMLLLTCLHSKVEMYEKMGFLDLGIADSSWGGEEWHEMRCGIDLDSDKSTGADTAPFSG